MIKVWITNVTTHSAHMRTDTVDSAILMLYSAAAVPPHTFFFTLIKSCKIIIYPDIIDAHSIHMITVETQKYLETILKWTDIYPSYAWRNQKPWWIYQSFLQGKQHRRTYPSIARERLKFIVFKMWEFEENKNFLNSPSSTGLAWISCCSAFELLLLSAARYFISSLVLSVLPDPLSPLQQNTSTSSATTDRFTVLGAWFCIVLR